MTSDRLETTYYRVADLTPYHRNAHKGNVARIRGSLRDHQQFKPVVVNRGTLTGRPNEVLCGSHTLMAAREEGWSELAAVTVDVDDLEAIRINVVDNPRAGHPEDLDYDERLLLELLADLPNLDGTGYDLGDVEALERSWRDSEAPPALNDPDSTPEPPTDPISMLGDVWELGPHRLVVGDSTDESVWTKLLVAGERPALVFTDPPYGIAYQAMRGGRKIANDGSEFDARQVTEDALRMVYDATAHFVCCDWRSMPYLFEAMVNAAIEPKACIVWDKKSRVQNLDRYGKQHEFILYAGPYGGQPTVSTDVWSFDRDFKPDHPTPKPVELIEKAVTTASEPDALVADPFGGSGSTLIACHGTNRRAALIELDPKYADVILRRYFEHAGVDPVRDDSVSWSSLSKAAS